MASLMQLKNSLPPNNVSDSRVQSQLKFFESQINLVLYYEIKGPENLESSEDVYEINFKAVLNVGVFRNPIIVVVHFSIFKDKRNKL